MREKKTKIHLMLIVYFMENLVDFVKIVLKGNILWTQIIRFGFLVYILRFKIRELMDLFRNNYSCCASLILIYGAMDFMD